MLHILAVPFPPCDICSNRNDRCAAVMNNALMNLDRYSASIFTSVNSNSSKNRQEISFAKPHDGVKYNASYQPPSQVA
jgi:hypothetical protein